MKIGFFSLGTLLLVLAGCASAPKANPALVESGCAQQCSAHLATCSSGFKAFPIVQQKQCNDTYDVCVKGCPARSATQLGSQSQVRTVAERLAELDALLKSGALSQGEYQAKRKEILGSL